MSSAAQNFEKAYRSGCNVTVKELSDEYRHYMIASNGGMIVQHACTWMNKCTKIAVMCTLMSVTISD